MRNSLRLAKPPVKSWTQHSLHARSTTFQRFSTMAPPSSFHKAPLHFDLICYSIGGFVVVGSCYFLQENLLFGTLGGMVAKTTTAPLERLSTYRQASAGSQKSLRRITIEIYRNEGTIGFWRGNLINVLRASVQKGSLFAFNDFFKSILPHTFSEDTSIPALLLSFLSGMFAGLASTIITYPLELVKTANQATIQMHPWPATTIWHQLVGARGYLYGPFTALLPTLFGTAMYYGIKFGSFDLFTLKLDHLSEVYCGGPMNRNQRNAIAGMCAGVIGNTIMFPNNCVRKTMQSANVLRAMTDPTLKNYHYFPTAKALWQKYGIKRFYAGFAINVVRNAPNTALQFVVYHQLKEWWQESTQHDSTPILTSDISQQ